MEDYTPKEEVKYTFRQRLENFWYHYKWHSIVSLFLIIAITVCTLQMCSKSEYDAYIMYAGPYPATQSEVRDIQTSLGSVCDDYNDDGESLVSISNLFMMTKEQIDERNAKDDGYEVNEKLISDNTNIFNQQIQIGEYAILLLDPAWVEFLYSANEADNILMRVEEFLPEGKELSLYGEYGVYLSSTGLYTLPGLCNLPDNTVLCMRKNGSLGSIFRKNSTAENHENHKALFKKLLAYTPS